MSHKPTGEQQAFIDGLLAGDSLVVDALAGAGKTTTLRMGSEAMTARRPTWRGRYVAYNKALAKEANGAFPSSVDCRTAHSVAFASHGRDLAHRIEAPRMTGKQAAEVMYAEGRYSETRVLNSPIEVATDVILTPAQIARLALTTVERYCQSDADEIGPQHVPAVPGVTDRYARLALTDVVVPIAGLAWRDLSHPRGRLKFFPDVYLKLWALDRPRINADAILFDEAQDANPVLSRVLRDQTHTQLVAVGDPYQQLYAWRGAVDALATWPADQRLTLAQSFRFGPAVADRANEWLGLLGAAQRVIGFDRIASRVEPLESPTAMLCRTNAGAMGRVMEHVEAGRKVHLVGGASEIKRFALAAMRLMDGQRADHPDLIAFDSWDAVQQYASQDEGGTLATTVKLIDDHGPEKLVQVADSLSVESAAEVTVSTGHKSKGRQWSTVAIAGDFREPFPREFPPDSGRRAVVLDASELMLLYVGVTRAVDVLDDYAVRWDLHSYGLPVLTRGAPSQPERAKARINPAAIMPDPETPDPQPGDDLEPAAAPTEAAGALPFGGTPEPAPVEPNGPALKALLDETFQDLAVLLDEQVAELYELTLLDEPGDLPPLEPPAAADPDDGLSPDCYRCRHHYTACTCRLMPDRRSTLVASRA